MNRLNELYRAKGEAMTNYEIWQGKINAINNEIRNELGKVGTMEKAKKEEVGVLPADVSPTENENG